MDRIILHSDINACYASVECALHPELRGKPVAVGGSVENRHGIILAKSQEAKICGVTTGEALWQAKQKCPDLIIIEPHFNEYQKYSHLVSDIYRRYTDLIEPFGLDECWLDVTGSRNICGSGEEMAHSIRKAVKKETDLTVSVGVSFNKIFAKLGSDMKKPDAVTIISKDNFKEKVWPLNACEMLGVGKATSRKLDSYGIHTIGQLAACDADWLRLVFGKCGTDLWKYANGLDDSRVKPDSYRYPAKSISHGITCVSDLGSVNEVWLVLLELAQDVGKRLKENKQSAGGVQIGLRDSTLKFKQFQASLPSPTQSAAALAKAALDIFENNYTWEQKVRAVTIGAIRLSSVKAPEQLSLFVDRSKQEKQEKLDSAVLALRDKFGSDAVYNACLMSEEKIPHHTPGEVVMPSKLYR